MEYYIVIVLIMYGSITSCFAYTPLLLRPSSPQLAQAFIDGVEAAGATYKDYG